MIEVLLEGHGGELYLQEIDATREQLELLISQTKSGVVKHHLQKQLQKLNAGI